MLVSVQYVYMVLWVSQENILWWIQNECECSLDNTPRMSVSVYVLVISATAITKYFVSRIYNWTCRFHWETPVGYCLLVGTGRTFSSKAVKLKTYSYTKPGEANVRIYLCCESLVLNKLSTTLPWPSTCSMIVVLTFSGFFCCMQRLFSISKPKPQALIWLRAAELRSDATGV